MEDRETPQECLVRETREDFGAGVTIREFFGESTYHYKHGSIRLLAYPVDWTGGQLSPVDHQDCRWDSFDDLENYEFLPADVPVDQRSRRTNHAT